MMKIDFRRCVDDEDGAPTSNSVVDDDDLRPFSILLPTWWADVLDDDDVDGSNSEQENFLARRPRWTDRRVAFGELITTIYVLGDEYYDHDS